MNAHTKETQDLMTPSSALAALKAGNDRFLKGNQVTRNLNQQDETLPSVLWILNPWTKMF